MLKFDFFQLFGRIFKYYRVSHTTTYWFSISGAVQVQKIPVWINHFHCQIENGPWPPGTLWGGHKLSITAPNNACDSTRHVSETVSAQLWKKYTDIIYICLYIDFVYILWMPRRVAQSRSICRYEGENEQINIRKSTKSGRWNMLHFPLKSFQHLQWH